VPYNGCILADSVGLGKTFTALAVIKYYELRNRSVLVLCPKKLEERGVILAEHNRGSSQRLIGQLLHRPASTICRELARGRQEDGPMIARGFLSGSFLGVPEPLVVQRKLSVSLGAGYRISDPVRWNSFVRSKMISQLTKLQDVQRLESRPELHRYESIILKRIKNLSRCLVQNKQVGSFGYRYYMALQLFLHYPGRYSFRGKLAFCLRFCEIFEVRFVQ